MDLYEAYPMMLVLLLPTIAWLAWRGIKARGQPNPVSSRVFRYSREQRRVTFCAGMPLAAFVALAPYRWAPLTDLSDMAIMLAILMGVLILLLEANNRLMIFSPEGISSSAWHFGNSFLPWAEIKRVTFYDTFGGFFLVHHAAGRLFIPARVERPIELLREMENRVPAAALDPAREGIALCRTHLS